jgi:FkbM family methyltransferase
MIKNLHYYRRTLGWAGIASAIHAKISNSTVLLAVKRRSVRAPIFLRVPSADVKVYEKVFLDEDYSFAVTREPRVIVDAGAHIGLASIYFANRYPEAKIIAIEPERQNFELLVKNVEPYKSVIPVHAALWSRDDVLQLLDPAGGNWGFITREKEASESSGIRIRDAVRGMTVSRLMHDYDLEKIDILKLDVEGSERELFGDSSGWLDRVDAVIVELHERIRPGCNRNFYKSTEGFGSEWTRGENVFVCRPRSVLRVPGVPNGYIATHSATEDRTLHP